MLHPGREDLAPKPGYEGMKAMKRKKDIGNSILEDMKYVKHRTRTYERCRKRKLGLYLQYVCNSCNIHTSWPLACIKVMYLLVR